MTIVIHTTATAATTAAAAAAAATTTTSSSIITISRNNHNGRSSRSAPMTVTVPRAFSTSTTGIVCALNVRKRRCVDNK